MMYIYSGKQSNLFQVGPYGPYHTTAATMAYFKKDIQQLGLTYDETLYFSEEKSFLQNYTIPVVQLDPKQSIVVFTHQHNSIDKEEFIQDSLRWKKHIQPAGVTLESLIPNQSLLNFYKSEVHKKLALYKEGDPHQCKENIMSIVERKKQERQIKKDQCKEMMIQCIRDETIPFESIYSFFCEPMDMHQLLAAKERMLKRIREREKKDREG